MSKLKEPEIRYGECGVIYDRGKGTRQRLVHCKKAPGHRGKHWASWGGSQGMYQMEWGDQGPVPKFSNLHDAACVGKGCRIPAHDPEIAAFELWIAGKPQFPPGSELIDAAYLGWMAALDWNREQRMDGENE